MWKKIFFQFGGCNQRLQPKFPSELENTLLKEKEDPFLFNLHRRTSQNMYLLWLEKSQMTLISIIELCFKIILDVLSHYSSPLYRNVCSHTAFRKKRT